MADATYGLSECGDNDLSDVEVIGMLTIGEGEYTGEVDSTDIDRAVRSGEQQAVVGFQGSVE